jgi:hypothetical protein
MTRSAVGSDEYLNSEHRSDSVVTTLWHTLIPLAITGAICISLVNVSVRINEIRNVRAMGALQAPAEASVPHGISAAATEPPHIN